MPGSAGGIPARNANQRNARKEGTPRAVTQLASVLGHHKQLVCTDPQQLCTTGNTLGQPCNLSPSKNSSTLVRSELRTLLSV